MMNLRLHLLFQTILHTRRQDCHLDILTQCIVGSRSPDHIDVRIQLVKEFINFLQLFHINRMLVARIDIKEDTFGFLDVVAIQQRRVERIQDSPLHTMITIGTPHRHDSTSTILHRRLHIAEVTLDAPIAGQGNQLRDTFHRIHQDIVSPHKGLLHWDIRVGINIAETLIVHYQQRIDILTQLIHALQCLDNLTLLLECERNRHHAHSQDAHILGHASNYRCSARTRTTPHTCRYESHFRSV